MTIKSFLKSGIAAGLLLMACQGAQAVENAGSLQGVVTDKAGKPEAGAFVKLKNAERRLTFMVVSQDKGTFRASDLPPGHYIVQGVGGNFESKWSAPVDVASGKATKVDVSLAVQRAPLLPYSWPGRLPEDQARAVGYGSSGSLGVAKPTNDLPAGDGKELVLEKCVVCHDLGRIKVARHKPDEWRHYVQNMRALMVAAKLPDLTNPEADKISKYLGAVFQRDKPYDENSRFPTALMQGKARNYRVVTYDLPQKFSEPHDIAVDPTGVSWTAEHAGRLLRFDPRTLEAVEVGLPPGPAAPEYQRLGNPQIDGKGMLWAADGPNNRWLRFDTKERKFTAFPFPEGHGGAGGNSMAIAKDGKVWSTGGPGVKSFDPATQEWKFYQSPSAKSDPGSYGVAVAGDGAVWWAEDHTDYMARLDPKTGKMDEFKIPVEGRIVPRRMNSDAEGDIWVGLWNVGKLMKVDHKTNKMTVYAPPTKNAGHYSTVADKKNNLIWVSEQEADLIGRFDPKTGEWVEFPLARAESDPRRIEIDPTNPNRVYFSGNSANIVGFVEYLPEAED